MVHTRRNVTLYVDSAKCTRDLKHIPKQHVCKTMGSRQTE